MNETVERWERGEARGEMGDGISECYSKREMLDDLVRNHGGEGGRKGKFIEKDSDMLAGFPWYGSAGTVKSKWAFQSELDLSWHVVNIACFRRDPHRY